jgi:formylglycine-generating enzyme required for sulfatase activity
MPGKFALIIGNGEYQDSTLRRLHAPDADARALADVLSNPGVGGFEVQMLVNESSFKAMEEIEAFFDSRKRDDLLLLYFSGHGVKDEDGQLYFAAANTKVNRLLATAIRAQDVNSLMRRCASRQQVLLLDCCYSGAFAKGMIAKAGAGIGTREQFEGRGRVILTASDAMQYAFEGDRIEGQATPSVFTRALLDGIVTGQADLDQDGRIAFDELAEYVCERVKEGNPAQTPQRWELGVDGKIYIARNPRPVIFKPVELPLELRTLIESPVASAREAAARELGNLAGGSHPGLALSALDALQKLADDDSRKVAAAANQILTALSADRAAKDAGRAEQERIVRERAEAEERARAEAEAKRLVADAERAERERIERERAEAEGRAKAKAEAERLAREKAEQERQAREKAEVERLVALKAELERQAQAKAEQERVAREKAEAERLAREKAEQERLARQKAEADRLAREKAEGERITREKARQPQPQRKPGLWGLSIDLTAIVGLVAVALLLCGMSLWALNGGLNPKPTPTAEVAIVASAASPIATTSAPPTATRTPTPPTPTPTATLTPTAAPGIGSTQISPIDGMVQVYVPAGSFQMGSDAGDSDEEPVHPVTLDAFWIDRTEVTNAMYALCVEAGKCPPPSSSKSYSRDSYYGNAQFDNYPVIYVTWDNAKTYCEWAGRRLPTEAEWEKAARETDGRTYPWGNEQPAGNLLNFADSNTNFDWSDKTVDDGYADTSPAGNYPDGASPYGALDMAGNVWEWVNDWYDGAYYGNSLSENPQGPASGQYRVLRGGSWSDDDGGVRAAFRLRGEPGSFYDSIGFRCARSP